MRVKYLLNQLKLYVKLCEGQYQQAQLIICKLCPADLILDVLSYPDLDLTIRATFLELLNKIYVNYVSMGESFDKPEAIKLVL